MTLKRRSKTPVQRTDRAGCSFRIPLNSSERPEEAGPQLAEVKQGSNDYRSTFMSTFNRGLPLLPMSHNNDGKTAAKYTVPL